MRWSMSNATNWWRCSCVRCLCQSAAHRARWFHRANICAKVRHTLLPWQTMEWNFHNSYLIFCSLQRQCDDANSFWAYSRWNCRSILRAINSSIRRIQMYAWDLNKSERRSIAAKNQVSTSFFFFLLILRVDERKKMSSCLKARNVPYLQ